MHSQHVTVLQRQILLSGNKNEAIGAAVSHLKKVLSNYTLLRNLVEGVEASENEKEQFLYISCVYSQY